MRHGKKKKTEVQLLVMGKGPILVQKEHKEMWPCPVEIDLVPNIVPEVVMADCKKVARRNFFRIDDGEEAR
jgi:oxalate decarboxylase/phosphoglucose isomerase-like protein (cupin superfamily)